MIYAGKKEDSRTSAAIALVVHVIIFLLIFFFMSFDLPDPPPAETYAELSLADFGYSDTGSGDNEGAPTQTSTAVAEETPEEAIVDDNSDVSNNVTETPSTSTQASATTANVKTAEQLQQEKEAKEAKEKADRIAQMMGNTGGDGNDNTGGNVGTQSGQIDGKGVFGEGGNSYNLDGRTMRGEPKFQGKPTKNGRVVVKIDVNRSGKVINAKVDQIRSNTTEQSLWDLAIKMAKTATFNDDKAAKIQQRGTITFTFKVN